jgi:hypothetical protein
MTARGWLKRALRVLAPIAILATIWLGGAAEWPHH